MGSGSDSDEGNNSDEEVRAQRAQKGVAPGGDSSAKEKPLPGQGTVEEDEGPGVEKVDPDLSSLCHIPSCNPVTSHV